MQREQANKLYATLMVNNQNKRKYKKQGETGLPVDSKPATLPGAKKMSSLVVQQPGSDFFQNAFLPNIFFFLLEAPSYLPITVLLLPP